MTLNSILIAALLLSPIVNASITEQTLVVGFGEKLPPFVFPDSNSGLTVDIITAALTPLGYTIESRYYPYTRRVKEYKKGNIDVVADLNLNTANGNILKGYLSYASYTYENLAFALSKNNFKLSEIADLKNYSLLSWPSAAIHLGDEYANMAKANPLYNEIHDQSLQVKFLYLDKVDVIQMDKQSFDYFRANIKDIDTTQKIDRFPLFGKSPNGYLFKSKKVRNDFNLQLQKLKESGKYKQIFDGYLK